MTKERTASRRPESADASRLADISGAIPVATRNYLAHVERGQTIRALAKEADVHPSTILRRVRRVEALREDPLLDAALRRLADKGRVDAGPDAALLAEARPVLRLLEEPGTVLAIARDMEKGVVARESAGGEPFRVGIAERRLAEDMALRGWIACTSAEARVQRYRLTQKGRLALRGLPGLAESAAAFDHGEAVSEDRLRQMRVGLVDTPVHALARRRDEEGAPFLGRELVAAAERLRCDLELATDRGEELPDWDRFLEELPTQPPPRPGNAPAGTPGARLDRALRELGPGLADVVLRCCCLLEGLETVERRLGWSARSGKVVLRLALWRLVAHYRAEDDRATPLIG